MSSRIREAFEKEPKRWMIYVYKGEIIIKEGVILCTEGDLPFPHYSFYPYDYYNKKYKYAYTQLSKKPLTLSYGKVWCELEDDIPKAINIIKAHYALRKKELEDPTPLRRAAKIVGQNNNGILKECPFCGSTCQVIKKVVEKGSNTNGKIPENAVLVKKKIENTVIRGEVIRYYWEREKYIPRCSNQECIIATQPKGYVTLAEAVKEWNKRSI